jgi:hypothetical protein
MHCYGRLENALEVSKHLGVIILQLLQADFAVLIGIDPLEEFLAELLIHQTGCREEFFFADNTILIPIKILHRLLGRRGSFFARQRRSSAIGRSGCCRRSQD